MNWSKKCWMQRSFVELDSREWRAWTFPCLGISALSICRCADAWPRLVCSAKEKHTVSEDTGIGGMDWCLEGPCRQKWIITWSLTPLFWNFPKKYQQWWRGQEAKTIHPLTQLTVLRFWKPVETEMKREPKLSEIVGQCSAITNMTRTRGWVFWEPQIVAFIAGLSRNEFNLLKVVTQTQLD